MTINTGNLVSITEAYQNFSRVARMADENSFVVILKNNTPRYMLVKSSPIVDENLIGRKCACCLQASAGQEPQGI